MIGSALMIAATLAAAQHPLTPPQQAVLDSLITERRQDGYGPGQIVSAGAADLTGDGQADVAAVYTYQMGSARNRSGIQLLVVLLREGSRYRALGPWVIGAKGHRLVDAVETGDGMIRLRGKQYLVSDPQASPTGVFEMELEVKEGRLREVRGRWFRP